MNDQEIIKIMDSVQKGSCQVATRMLVVRQQGRMLTLVETREVDTLSKELLQNVRALSAYLLAEILSPVLRARAEEMVGLAKESLEMVVFPVEESREPRKGPRAASSRLSAYCEC